MFMPVKKPTKKPAIQLAGGQDDGDEHFYLAINRNALGKQWFYTVFLKQFFPGGVLGGRPVNLGTRVISFELQNGKLYVFDVDARRKISDLYNPQVLVDAFPIVDGFRDFERRHGADNYVLIDVTEGLSDFDFVSDAYSFGYLPDDGQPRRFEIELSYLQRFRAIADGVTFEKVFTGYTDIPDDKYAIDPTEVNPYRASGTLGVALRAYKESEAYVPVLPLATDNYFMSDPFWITNYGFPAQLPVHFAIAPGAPPVEFVISPLLQQYIDGPDSDPRLASYDIVGAVQRAVLSWNEVFGFEALSVRLGNDGESYADDDKNFIIFDPDPQAGFAFADWRINPNTGETRGASVYFNSTWFDYVDILGGDATARPAKPRPNIYGLQWNRGAGSGSAIEWMDDWRFVKEAAAAEAPFETFIQHVIAHEIGHTLGLRHNFKGSLTPPSGSVMDYLVDADSIAAAGPQAYDAQAIGYLYSLTPDAPTAPFCTDADQVFDPTCGQFDTGADPLRYTREPDFDLICFVIARDNNFDGYARYFPTYVEPTLGFVRAGNDADAAYAWNEVVVARIGTPDNPLKYVDSPLLLNRMSQYVFDLLLIHTNRPYPNISGQPDTMLSAIIAEAGAQLRNVDGLRDFATRKMTIDALKAAQSFEALQILNDAKAEFDALIAGGTLSGEEALMLGDLRARIVAVTSPYID